MSGDYGLLQLVRQRINASLHGDDQSMGTINIIAGLGPGGILKDYAAYYAACMRVQAMIEALKIIEGAHDEIYNPKTPPKPGAK